MVEDEGQSTVEYLAVLLGVAAVVVGLHALVAAGERGVFSSLATALLSHAVGGAYPSQAMVDIFLF